MFPLIIFIIVKIARVVLKKKEEKYMHNKINIIDILNFLFDVLNNLSGNVTGGALLANAL